MRKGLRMLLLGAVFTVLLCTSALAAGEKGICGISGSGLTPQDASGNAVSTSQEIEGKQVYLDSERVQLAYSGAAAGTEYLVVVLEDADASNPVPTANNIVYIDQKSGTDANDGFNLYPSRLVSGKTYNVYVANTGTGVGESTKAGSFSYYAQYTPGDVNSDNAINTFDALAAIQHFVGQITLSGDQFLAADVAPEKGVINVYDAMAIIQHFVGQITSFA